MEELHSTLLEITNFMKKANHSLVLKAEKYEQSLSEMMHKANLDRTPVQNKKRPKRVNSTEEEEDKQPKALNSITEEESFAESSNLTRRPSGDDMHNLSSASSSRPSRNAKSKAITHLKEPKLNTKMRNHIKNGEVVIKQERISVIAEEEKPENSHKVDTTKIKVEKSFIKRKTKQKSNDSAEDNYGRNNSIELVQEQIEHIEIVDDDDAEMMPPPKAPLVRKVGRQKIKKEPIDIDVSSSVSEKTSKRIDVSSTESEKTVKRSTRTKQKDKTASKSKIEAMVIDDDDDDIPIIKLKREKPSTSKQKSKSPQSNQHVSPAKSDMSVYEDAIEGSNQQKQDIPATDFTFSVDKNGTFAIPVGQLNGKLPVVVTNSTFAIPNEQSPGNGTFVLSNLNNETFNVPQPNNGTFSVQKNGLPMNSSIMTDDNSQIEDDDEEIVPPPPLAKTTKTALKKNELFNPCLQSPVKSRIEAFEKAAIHSPARAVFGKNTPVLKMGKTAITTPVIPPRIVRKAGQSNTPNSAPSSAKVPSSGSKKTGAIPKQSTSREPSVERPGSAMEERKKKREEKARLAQQQREQMEKDKREMAEKLLREKEEKHKKLLAEKEEKRKQEALKKAKQLEEFEKRRILEEQQRKREELVRLEQQQRDQNDLKIKENYEKNMQKQLMQQKLQKQQQLQMQMQKAKANELTFDMLQTDDSTDDESTSHKKKRPPPPEWCQKILRRAAIESQTYVPVNVIDDFFSVAPCTPDLKEIFPKIDSRKLKRNSSAIWRTPPRYSQMPKY